MAPGPNSTRVHQGLLLGLIAGIVVLLVALAWLASEICALHHDLAALGSTPSPVLVIHQAAQPVASLTGRPPAGPSVQPSGSPTSRPSATSVPPPAAQPSPTAHALALVQPAPEPSPAVYLPLAQAAADPGPATTTIELRVLCPAPGCAPLGLQTVVQWQDGAGAWHDVPGWRGALGKDGRRIWGVGEKDLGTGPFRWLVLNSCGCQVRGASQAFRLPAQPGETLHVEVALGG